jgi:hypothetical protein
VQGWQFAEVREKFTQLTYSEAAAERLAMTHSSRSGNAPKPPPPKLRAPEEPSGTPSAEQAFALRDELKIGQLADQNAQTRKTGMKRGRRKTAGDLTASLGGLVGKQSLQDRGDRSPRRCVTNTRMRHDWCSPTVESKIGQRYLGQNQNSGEQNQLENEYHQLPALHGTD